MQSSVERGALVLVIALGFLSIIAPIARFVVFHWLYTNPAHVTASNFHIMELLTRIEILFGTAAYSLVVSRALLRKLARRVSSFTVSIRDAITGKERRVHDSHSLATYGLAEPPNVEEYSSGSAKQLFMPKLDAEKEVSAV